MFSAFDPLVDFSCPLCSTSLRFRRVQELPQSKGSPNFLCACPSCNGKIIFRQHKAFPDNWRWMIFIWPGMFTLVVAVTAPSIAWLAPLGLLISALGVVALVGYMIWSRIGFLCYVHPESVSE